MEGGLNYIMEQEFKKFPKIPRLRRDIIVTEKIDGTNAQINIIPVEHIVQEFGDLHEVYESEGFNFIWSESTFGRCGVLVGSRNRWITPEVDNYGFARWVSENIKRIIETLGLGRHHGEWWGQGIQRRYNMDKKVFSLFNTKRFNGKDEQFQDDIRVTPILYEGPWSDEEIDGCLLMLEKYGSTASLGFNKPEGIVVYHTAANSLYKVTLEGDGGKWKT